MVWNAYLRRSDLDPWRELRQLHDQVEHVFADLASPGSAEFPPIDVWSGEEGLILHAQLPGVPPDGIDISVVGQTLTLKGERPGHDSGDGSGYHRREREEGRFVRTIQLPFPVEGDKVRARSRNGTLEVELPRAASDRPRRIAVTQ
jgi:HSP20 family protein